MELKETIKILSAFCAPSGCESPVSSWIMEQVAPYCDEVHTDIMGNVIAVQKCGKENAQRVMMDAHMDEVGLIVTGIEKGFLHFGAIGGVDARILPATQVKVLTDPPIFGVIDTMPPHALSAEEMDKPIAMDKLTIDIGMTQEDAEAAVALGTTVSYYVEPVEMGKYKLAGKSLDDRACDAIIMDIMKNLHGKKLDVDIYYQFSTQEEVGTRGAIPGCFSIDPDYAIVMDVTHAKTPDEKGLEIMDLGKGPAIGIGPNMCYPMTKSLEETAKTQDIPYQMEVIPGHSGTNGWPIQISRGGVATAIVSLPLRYMHTPHEVMDLRDAENTVRLVTAYVLKTWEVQA